MVSVPVTWTPECLNTTSERNVLLHSVHQRPFWRGDGDQGLEGEHALRRGMSIGLSKDRECAPPASSCLIAASRWPMERARRSKCTAITRVSLCRMSCSSLASTGRPAVSAGSVLLQDGDGNRFAGALALTAGQGKEQAALARLQVSRPAPAGRACLPYMFVVSIGPRRAEMRVLVRMANQGTLSPSRALLVAMQGSFEARPLCWPEILAISAVRHAASRPVSRPPTRVSPVIACSAITWLAFRPGLPDCRVSLFMRLSTRMAVQRRTVPQSCDSGSGLTRLAWRHFRLGCLIQWQQA